MASPPTSPSPGSSAVQADRRRTLLPGAIGVLVGIAAAWCLTWLIVARGSNEIPPVTHASPSPELIARAAGIRVFFGHQSIGNDILAALAADPAATPLAIREIRSAAEISGPGIYHARIGRNAAPLSKIEVFERMLVNEGIGARVDVAVMKLCYVDFQKDTAPQAVLDAYLASVDRIQAALPWLALVHTTVPLAVHVKGLKSRLRNVIQGDRYNMNRSDYNQSLLTRLASTSGQPAIYDIARLESTRPDGSRESFSFRGHEYFALHPGYTHDGGHLDAVAARLAAVEFITVLAKPSAPDLVSNGPSIPPR